MWQEVFFSVFLGLVLIDILYYPERGLEREYTRINKKIQLLRRGGLLAKLITWVEAPFLRGDVIRYTFLLEQKRYIIRRQIQLYKEIRKS